MDEDAYGDIDDFEVDQDEDSEKTEDYEENGLEDEGYSDTEKPSKVKNDDFLDTIVSILRSKLNKFENLYLPLKNFLDTNKQSKQFNDTERKFVSSLFVSNGSYILSLLFYLSMRSEGAPTKNHPILKKQVAKKQLVDFYDNIEMEYKHPLKKLIKKIKAENIGNKKISNKENEVLLNKRDYTNMANDTFQSSLVNRKKLKIGNDIKKQKLIYAEEEKIEKNGVHKNTNQDDLLNLNYDDVQDDEEEKRLNEDNQDFDEQGSNDDEDGFDDDLDSQDEVDMLDGIKLDSVDENDIKKKELSPQKSSNKKKYIFLIKKRNTNSGEQLYNALDDQKRMHRETLKEKIRDKLNKIEEKKLAEQFVDDGIDNDEARLITRTMQLNKGFTRKRKKEDYNPRLKRRKKYERAKYKRVVILF